MTWTRLIKAGLIGCVLAAPMGTPASAQSVLKVLRGATSSNITVSVNRAVVMEADRPFGELSVANPSIADIATLGERTIYVLGKTPGRTTLTILGEDGSLVTNVDVQVAPDLAEFKERLRDILPSEDIEVRTANDGIVLSGRISGARKLSRAIELAERYAPGRVTNLMVVGGTQQVMLKVRFAEMSRSVAKELNSTIVGSISDDTNVGVIGGGRDVGVVDDAPPFIIGGDTFGAIGATATIGDLALNALVEALENKGVVRTLAEPNLVAISGETASFLAGGEVGIPIRTEDSTSVQFKEFGVRLNFQPFVIDDDLIKLILETEVSSIDTTDLAVGAVTLDVRRAQTSVEMRDGQSFAIAGLLRDDFTDSVGQVPWLGDIPILGALFRSTSFRREQSELVVIITPHLVTPTDGTALALPTDRLRIPNELELFVNGRTSGSQAVQDIAQQDFQGSYGYVME
ncbi:type II and III secretion system protein family protein [Algicella marina]|uniref:General secretion pathway protein n=1 Tax=Algicella marina TaxID=2683284 RepID=A0A6P1T9C0_9RHOB|nr:type II and III secretion system protein family protein [Algicella marina]QHQ37232.1 general secretion pathway protein [Algicella marina]